MRTLSAPARRLAIAGPALAAPYPGLAVMTSRSSRRWLAPTALAASALAVLLTVVSGGGTEAPVRSTSVAPASSVTTSAPTTYTVRPGDVLSTIAERSGVSLALIQKLNPDVDAKALHAGQQIKLAP